MRRSSPLTPPPRSRAARSCATASCSATHTTAATVLAAADELVREAGLEPARARRARRRHRAGQLHLDPDRARDRARARARARPPRRRRLDARRFAGGTPVIDARRGEVFTTGRRWRGRRSSTSPGRGSSATAPCATATSSRQPAPRCRPTTTRDHLPAAHRLVARADGASARPTRSSPSTSAPRTRCRADDRRRDRAAPLALAHLGEIEEIERSAYPTPWSRTMFAVRAREADVDLPRRVRGRPARRLHHQLALRRRLARDERRRRPRPPPPRHRDAPARARCSS